MVSTSHFLSTPSSPRKVAHTRTIQLEAYERDDGLMDLEALLEDSKPDSFTTLTRDFPCGVPIHLIAIRLTVNKAMDIVGAEAQMPRTPLPQTCPDAALNIERLIGANLLQGFRKEVSKRLPASLRCSHVSEMAALLPTLAIQSMMKEQAAKELNGAAGDTRPLKIGGCHAWREDGPVVLKYYPQWYVKPNAEAGQP
ncbi:MAG TPA: DUF2889 domain-containing protein [Burkholderiaceae bacterium]|nr:DUF2889 domain-containing protein [Burkholderiaceae bacterium]